MATHAEKIQPLYRWDTAVSSFEVGPDRLLTLSGQLRLQQEVGEKHFAEGGCGFAGMAALGMAFVAVQNNAVITRRPKMGEPITLLTWHRETHGVRFFRCYRFLDAAGNTLIDSVCTFALVDVNTHQLLRPKAFEALGITPSGARPHGCPDPQKLRLPDTMTPCGTHTVRYSQLDFNGHFNNTCYADVLMDYGPIPLENREITGFSVAYLHEARQGDTLALTAAVLPQETGTQLLMHAENGDTACFTAELRLK